MQALSAQQLLGIWELGVGQHAIDRALIILAAAFPGKAREALATLSIGQRDAWLLRLRELSFGSKFDVYAECQQCRERLEFTLPVAALRIADAIEPGEQPYELTVEDYRVRFRLPDSQDLTVAAGCADTASARQELLVRCVLQLSHRGAAVAVEDLPDGVVGHLAGYMAECDPQAEVLLDLLCPACGHRWRALFDIATFFWIEIATQAKRLLREVHALARAYNWAEADILAMSAWRRECYLSMVGV